MGRGTALTKSEVKKAAKGEQPTPGKYAFLPTDAENVEYEGVDDISQRVTFKRLTNPRDRNSGEGRDVSVLVGLPLKNPAVADHFPGEMTVNGFAVLAAAMFPDDVPALPRKDKRTKVYHFKGEEIDKNDYDACKEEVVEAANAIAPKLDDKPELWVEKGGVFYADLYYKNPGDRFPKLRGHRSDPGDWEIITDKAMFDTFGADPDTAGNGTSKSTSRSKGSTAGARGAKKKTSRRGSRSARR